MAAVLIPSLTFRLAHEAQAKLCDEADEVERIAPFDDYYVENFIIDFAKSEGDAEMWLQDQGIDKSCIATAELLRRMAQTWVKSPLGIYDVAGIYYWRAMKDLAYEVWSK